MDSFLAKKIIICMIVLLKVADCNSQEFRFYGNVVDFVSDISETYYSKDSIIVNFYKDNQKRIEDLNDSFILLPIDRCHNGNIVIEMIIDSVGQTQSAVIVNGPELKKLNQAILNIVLSYPGNWRPAIDATGAISIKINLSFFLLNGFSKTKKTRKEDAYHVSTEISRNVNHLKVCSDCDYFYNQGVEDFKNENYKSALYNFKKSIFYNPYDIDALYNLSQVYFKLEKNKNACECLSLIYKYGDKSVQSELKEKCNNIQSE